VSSETLTPIPEAAARQTAGRRRRAVALIALLWLVLLAAAILAFLVTRASPRPAGSQASDQLRVTGIPAVVPTSLADLMGLSPVPSKDAPAFTLVDQSGRTLSLATFRGRAVVLEFMDPHCVDICPLVSQEFLNAYRDLGAAASGVVFVAVNVNRYHAGVADVAAFSQAHRLSTLPSWHFFTGPVPTLQAAWKAYDIVVTERGRNADIVHTDTVFFIDPQGRERFVAAPMADYTANGAAYLPSVDLASWGRGIALVAHSLT
jgi:cytochrome oxidase Cu insertion factor (SCO1/SenC/PrrC family)